jgi:ABC-type dipeptide/oligopeptide/nickel transport system ATPase component
MKTYLNILKGKIKKIIYSRKIVYIKSSNFHIFELIGQSGSGKTHLLNLIKKNHKETKIMNISIYEDIFFTLDSWEKDYLSLLLNDSKSNSDYIKLMAKHLFPRLWINKFISRKNDGIYFFDEGLITDVFNSIKNLEKIEDKSLSEYLSQRTFIYLNMSFSQLKLNHEKRNAKIINQNNGSNDETKKIELYQDSFNQTVNKLKKMGANVIEINAIDGNSLDIIFNLISNQLEGL